MKSLASMNESSGSHFFRTTTGIQSGRSAFDEPRLVITFLTNFGVLEILCSFGLVVAEKEAKEIPESSRLVFFEKFLSNNLLYQMQRTGLLNGGGIADLPLLRSLYTILRESQVSEK